MSKGKTNPRRVPVSKADMERCKIQAAAGVVEAVYAIFYSACWDYMGFSKEQMQELWKAVQRVAESVRDGYATIPQLTWTLKHEAGIELDNKKYFGG